MTANLSWPRGLRHNWTLDSATVESLPGYMRHTRTAWYPRGSWLMAISSGAVRISMVRCFMRRGSFPRISGAASMHQNEKTVRCSVVDSPPTSPHNLRVTYDPPPPIGNEALTSPSEAHAAFFPERCGGHVLTWPYADILSRPTTSMSGSLTGSKARTRRQPAVGGGGVRTSASYIRRDQSIR